MATDRAQRLTYSDCLPPALLRISAPARMTPDVTSFRALHDGGDQRVRTDWEVARSRLERRLCRYRAGSSPPAGGRSMVGRDRRIVR